MASLKDSFVCAYTHVVRVVGTDHECIDRILRLSRAGVLEDLVIRLVAGLIAGYAVVGEGCTFVRSQQVGISRRATVSRP